MTRPCWPIGLIILLLGYDPGVQAAPITFNTALPVAAEEFVFRLQVKAGKTEEERDIPRRQASQHGIVSVLGYGVTPDLTVFAVLPYFRKKLELNSTNVNRSSDGLSDLSVFARYTVYKRDSRGKTFRIAPFLGFKLATGEDAERDSLGTLPPDLQSGTGSTDYFGGAIATYQTLDWELDSQIRLDVSNEANGFEAGDKVSLAVSLQYRVWPAELSATTAGFLYLAVESDLSHRAKARVLGSPDRNSGGDSWFVSPGIQYVTRRWVAEFSIQVPVKQNLNGTALETDYRFSGGLRWNF